MAIYPMLISLLVDLPIRKMMDFVSWDDFPFPTEWKVIKFHGSSHHQPGISCYISIETIKDRYSSVQAPQSECPKHSFHPPAMRRVP